MILQNWWYTTLLNQEYPKIKPLNSELKADVLIVGGGMTGISAACALMNKGVKVVLIEKNILGGSSTGASAGFLTPDSELELSQLERRYGIEGAKTIWNVPVQGIQLIVERAQKFEINCDLQKQDSLFVGIGENGKSNVDDERESRDKVGFLSTQYNEKELKNILGGEGYTGAVRYADTYGISALQFSQGIKKILIDAGIQIFEATEALKIEGHKVITHAGSITADQIIIAADKIEPELSHFSKDIFHAQTFLSISEPLSDKELNSLFPSGEQFQCWDSTLVYSYWRLTGDRRLLLGGGNAITTFMNQSYNSSRVIDSVVSEFKKRFHGLSNLHFRQFWPGLIDTTRDLLPTLVRDAEAPHVHYALGVVGLPWASFCGDFLGRVVLGTATQDEMKYFSYFSNRRSFLLPSGLQKVVGKAAVFSLNNLWAKYYQVDTDKKLKFERSDF